MCSPRSEVKVTLVASFPEDAFIDLTADSFLGLLILSIAVAHSIANHNVSVEFISMVQKPPI